MKKVFILIIASLLLKVSPVHSQIYNEGDIIVEGFYGWPNLWTIMARASLNPQGAQFDNTMKVNSMGPIGVRAEYHFGGRIGLGLMVNYGYTKVYGTVEEMNPQGNIQEYNYTLEVPRTRVLTTFNVHLGNNEKLDPYFLTGIGWLNQSVIVETDSPNSSNINMPALIPIAFRMAEFGLRGYFSDNIGAHFAIGLGGGPLLQTGLTIKL